MSRRSVLWVLPALLYAAFALWYTDFGGPLRDDEIEEFVLDLEAAGATPRQVENLRRFMVADTGRQFLMVNLLDLAEDPPDVPGAAPGESAQQLMGRYMEHMYAELLVRACHPIFMGEAVFRAVDVLGIEGAEEWDLAALMRYRSRRALIEVVANPETLGRHEFKLAALEKTLAFPVEAVLYPSDPRFLLALLLTSATALLDIALFGRRG